MTDTDKLSPEHEYVILNHLYKNETFGENKYKCQSHGTGIMGYYRRFTRFFSRNLRLLKKESLLCRFIGRRIKELKQNHATKVNDLKNFDCLFVGKNQQEFKKQLLEKISNLSDVQTLLKDNMVVLTLNEVDLNNQTLKLNELDLFNGLNYKNKKEFSTFVNNISNIQNKKIKNAITKKVFDFFINYFNDNISTNNIEYLFDFFESTFIRIFKKNYEKNQDFIEVKNKLQNLSQITLESNNNPEEEKEEVRLQESLKTGGTRRRISSIFFPFYERRRKTTATHKRRRRKK